jgi:GTP-binding protein HflX
VLFLPRLFPYCSRGSKRSPVPLSSINLTNPVPGRTEAGVLESARIFATLDPKLRQLQLPSRRKILLSDTVGFIRNLPPTLITSFRVTLEEVERAEILLHVQDAASPMREEQKTQVEKVLTELAVSTKHLIQVLNKVDLVPPRNSRTSPAIAKRFPSPRFSTPALNNS